MLNLAIAQVSGSLVNGDESVAELTESFTSMAGAIMEIRETIEATGTPVEGLENNVLETIDQKCQMLSDKVQSAIIAFQFYDRFTQNLSHVNESLNSLGDLIGDQSKLYNPEEWTRYQQAMRNRYSMPEEHEMFDMIVSGASVAEVLENFKSKKVEHEVGEIELF
jgi:uncharacterized protein YqgV (UPF0045/DUF77 family)